MRIKKGVKLQGVSNELTWALPVIFSAYQQYNQPLTITSVCDGKHSRNSLHYAGQAVDLRTRGIEPETIEGIASVIRAGLTIDFDVVVESTHIHVEYQPRGNQ